MNKNIIIETERLILRQWNMNDIDDMVEGLNNINVTKWLVGAPFPYTAEDAKYFIQNTIDKDLYNFAIILKSKNKAISGTQLTDISMANGVAGGGICINEKLHKMQLKFDCKDEGIKRQRFISKATGKVEDEYITGLLKEEWKKTLEK